MHPYRSRAGFRHETSQGQGDHHRRGGAARKEVLRVNIFNPGCLMPFPFFRTRDKLPGNILAPVVDRSHLAWFG